MMRSWMFLVCALLRTEAFSVVQTRRSAHGSASWHSSKTTTTTTRRSAFPDGDKLISNDSGSKDFSDFNPFSYQTDKNKKSGGNPNIISLRKTAMQALTYEMLDSVQDPERMQTMLQDNRDFLLETLEDKDAVLDPDSVYTYEMSRAERYQAYRNTMEERMSTAKNPAVQQVLTALYDFVTSHE
jgi:hypothetical protein